MKRKITSLFSVCLAVIMIVAPVTGFTAAAKEGQKAENKQSKTLRFYLVRHGQTYSNIKEMTIGGGGNAQLTKKGRDDATCVGLGLADVNFIAGYSSTLGRAYETASYILKGRNMQVSQIANLKDISWGDAEGGRIDDLTGQFGHSGNDFLFYFGSYTDPDFKSPVNAENMHQFSARFDAALRDIAKNYPDQEGNILVVAHSSMAFYLQKYRADLPLTGLSNTSASVLELKDGEFRLVDFNNTDYLQQGCKKKEKMAPLEITVVINPMTVLNQAGVMEGRSDSDLTKAGIKASQTLAAELKKVNYVAAYSSTLSRAYNTADIVLANKGVTLTKDSNLDEMFLGYWEAEKVTTLKNNKAVQSNDLFSADKVINFISSEGGESGVVAAYRLNSALAQIGNTYEFSNGKVIVFTHPIAMKAFLNQQVPGYKFNNSNELQVITLNYKDEAFSVKSVKAISAKK